ncbi:MAG: EamA family transporter [Candidatus Nucleicultricaceae bacterium]
MTLQHTFFAILTAFIWGVNFIAIKLSYESFTPFALLTVRFLATVFPLIFFVKKPDCSWLLLFKIALFLWLGQFIFTFLAIYMGMPAGITALVLQVQAIFTVGLTAMLHSYRPRLTEILGIFISLMGIALIGCQIEGKTNLIGFFFLLLGALSTSFSNLLYRGKTNVNPLGLVVWSSLIPPIPLFILSLIFEGPWALITSFERLTFVSGSSVLYTSYFSTVIGSSLWAYLLRNYEPARVVPFGLLVPVFSIVAAFFVLDETVTLETILAASLIILGLLLNQVFSQYDIQNCITQILKKIKLIREKRKE